MEDWISRYVEVTHGMAAPTIFRQWVGISIVACCMERRCWVETNIAPPTYPNMYVMLVAPPGIGKTLAINPAIDLLTAAKEINVAPPSMTKAALVDTLRDSRRLFIHNDGINLIEYNSLQVFASELGVLINQHDLEFLAVVNDIFDNPKTFRERRRWINNGQEVQINNPQLNILVGAQPVLLSTILPEEAWGLGTTARFIMVYADTGNRPELFSTVIDREGGFKELLDQIKPWLKLYGKFSWEPEAITAIRKYYFETDYGPKPVPDAPKLTHYNTRRVQFMIKLAMISTLSRTSNLIIGEYDVERARFWLLEAEATMPGIFHAMTLKTDAQLIEEMHIWAWKEYREQGGKMLSVAGLHKFLSHRVYSERIPKIIDIAFKSRLLEDIGGGLYKPSPRLDLVGDILRKATK